MRLRHLNQTKNLNNKTIDKNLEEVITQLRRSDIQKNRLIKSIYKLYEDYLKFLRETIFTSVEKGIYGLCSEMSINDKFINPEGLSNVLKKDLSLLINSQLPLITIEQLKLTNNSNHSKLLNIYGLEELGELKEYETNIFEYYNNSTIEEPFRFHCSDNRPITYENYQSLSEDDIASVNLDEKDNLDCLSKQIIIKKIDKKEHFVVSSIELIEHSNHEDSDNSKNQISEVFISNHNLDFFYLIDRSLTNLLLNFSYAINLELFQIKLIKRLVSMDNFKSLVNKNYIIKHPYPFVIKFDLDNKLLTKQNGKSSNIHLFNLTKIELEYNYLDLSICRDKINSLKNKFKLLLKKERYWKKKEFSIININK